MKNLAIYFGHFDQIHYFILGHLPKIHNRSMTEEKIRFKPVFFLQFLIRYIQLLNYLQNKPACSLVVSPLSEVSVSCRTLCLAATPIKCNELGRLLFVDFEVDG